MIINISNKISFRGLSKLIEREKDKCKLIKISKTILIYLPSKISNQGNNTFISMKTVQINKKSLSMLMDPDSQARLITMDKVMVMELSTILTVMQHMKVNGNMEILMVKADFIIHTNLKWKNHTIIVILQKWMNTLNNFKVSSTTM